MTSFGDITNFTKFKKKKKEIRYKLRSSDYTEDN